MGAVKPCPIIHDRESGEFRLAADWQFPALGSWVTVPVGTATDLASVPRVLRWLVGRFVFSVEAAVAHDHLYRTGGRPPFCTPPRSFSRYEADVVFYELMRERRVANFWARLAFDAVREFGAAAWRGMPDAREAA